MAYKSDLETMTYGERILWRSKPDKLDFILESIFNPMLQFALPWALLDITVLKFLSSQNDAEPNMVLFDLIFFAIHLMPVWIYLGGIIASVIRYKNTEFIITERGIYISGGVISMKYDMKPFAELSHISIHRGIFDRLIGVGDVVCSCNHGINDGAIYLHNYTPKNTSQLRGITICNIRDYQNVFEMVKKLQTDIYSDTMYPNALRPETNPGYNTKYTGYRGINPDIKDEDY